VKLGLQRVEPIVDDCHLTVDAFLFIPVELAWDCALEVAVE